MINWRSLSGLLLALVMAGTSVTMAVARAQEPMGDRVEICGGFGQVFVTLDASGQPMAPRHSCPDCLGGLAAIDFPGVTATPHPPQSAGQSYFVANVRTVLNLPQPQATARGPPSLI